MSIDKELLEALHAEDALIVRAQQILGEYLEPGGLTDEQAMDALLALFDGPEQRLAQRKAHAAMRLIAAAPDLLEACRRIVSEDAAGEISIGAIEDCQQAIQKAEGDA